MRGILSFTIFVLLAIIAMPLGGCDKSPAIQPPAADEIRTEADSKPGFDEKEAEAAERAANPGATIPPGE